MCFCRLLMYTALKKKQVLGSFVWPKSHSLCSHCGKICQRHWGHVMAAVPWLRSITEPSEDQRAKKYKPSETRSSSAPNGAVPGQEKIKLQNEQENSTLYDTLCNLQFPSRRCVFSGNTVRVQNLLSWRLFRLRSKAHFLFRKKISKHFLGRQFFWSLKWRSSSGRHGNQKNNWIPRALLRDDDLKQKQKNSHHQTFNHVWNRREKRKKRAGHWSVICSLEYNNVVNERKTAQRSSARPGRLNEKRRWRMTKSSSKIRAAWRTLFHVTSYERTESRQLNHTQSSWNWNYYFFFLGWIFWFPPTAGFRFLYIFSPRCCSSSF